MLSVLLEAGVVPNAWAYNRVDGMLGASVLGPLVSLEPDDDDDHGLATLIIYRNVVDGNSEQDLVILDLGEEHEVAFNEEGESTAILHIDGEMVVKLKTIRVAANRLVFDMSLHLLMLLRVSKEVMAIFDLVDGTKWMANFKAGQLSWDDIRWADPDVVVPGA